MNYYENINDAWKKYEERTAVKFDKLKIYFNADIRRLVDIKKISYDAAQKLLIQHNGNIEAVPKDNV